MGFFKKLFKRKRGGTMFGNLLRGAASAATGGVLGSGAGLAAWEAKQRPEVHPVSTLAHSSAILPQSKNRSIDGKQMGADLLNKIIIPNTGNGGQTNQTLGNSVMTEQLKKKWYIPTGILIFVAAVTYFITQKSGGRRKAKY
jgi:hypothetical protein